MWSILDKKVPTWEVNKKRKIVGPRWCILFKLEEET